MGLSSIGQLSLRVAIPVPAPLPPRCGDTPLLWGHPELAALCIPSEPASAQHEPTVPPPLVGPPRAEGQEEEGARAGSASPGAPSPPPLFRMSLARPALLGTVITRCLARCPAGMDVFLMTGCSAKPHIQS